MQLEQKTGELHVFIDCRLKRRLISRNGAEDVLKLKSWHLEASEIIASGMRLEAAFLAKALHHSAYGLPKVQPYGTTRQRTEYDRSPYWYKKLVKRVSNSLRRICRLLRRGEGSCEKRHGRVSDLNVAARRASVGDQRQRSACQRQRVFSFSFDKVLCAARLRAPLTC